jgi:hypothetical protein
VAFNFSRPDLSSHLAHGTAQRLPAFTQWLGGLRDRAMLNVQEFFQHQVDECLELAKGATHREDAEFWEASARRWAELAQHKVKREAASSPVDQHQSKRQ